MSSRNPGRKVIIVLSDGENFPFFTHRTGAPRVRKARVHSGGAGDLQPGRGDLGLRDQLRHRRTRWTGTSATSRGKRADGFSTRPARSSSPGVYKAIHRQVAGEYLLTYRATMSPAEKKYLQARVTSAGAEPRRPAFTFPASVFGPAGWPKLSIVAPPSVGRRASSSSSSDPAQARAAGRGRPARSASDPRWSRP